METSRPCHNCRSKTLVPDSDTGKTVCTSCGVVQEFDNFQHHIGGITGPAGTYIRLGTSGTGNVSTFKETKIYHAQKFIEEFMLKLDLSGSKAHDVRILIEKITEGEYGQGDWFPVFVGACAYVVMRNDHKMLPIGEVADLVGCDTHVLGQMISRVVKFRDLKLPEFDIVNCFERSLKKCPTFSQVPGDVIEKMLKQGVFLVQCLIKWYVTTGRRPMPVVGAVLVLVSQLNEVSVKMEDVAKELHVALSTCRKRYKELLERLVEVGRVLPWGKDLNIKNIVKNTPFVIQYMEMKSVNKEGSFENFQFDMEGLVGDCLRKEIGYGFDCPSVEEDSSSRYFEMGGRLTLENDCMDRFQISPECLTMIYSDFLNEVSLVKANEESGLEHNNNNNNRKGRKDFDLRLCYDWWEGKSDLSKKLLLKQILEKDVGLDVMPPSFNKARLDDEKRREKIKAAKVRIQRIMHPGSAEDYVVCPVETMKKRKRMNVDIDWEDLIIESLLLHKVKEEEIEKGYYNVLLDLHVFTRDNDIEEEITSD